MLYPWERVHCKTGMFLVASTRSRDWIKYRIKVYCAHTDCIGSNIF